jgi:hypothetical protein
MAGVSEEIIRIIINAAQSAKRTVFPTIDDPVRL